MATANVNISDDVVISQNIPQVNEEEIITPKENIKLRLQKKVKELINKEDILEELLTNPTLLGKRKWESRIMIGCVFNLNIADTAYDHLDDKILDMYNNGMKDEYLETTDKYMMECVADYMGTMINFNKNKIDYYVRSIKASTIPADIEYIEKNYYELSNIVADSYKNYDLALKLNCMSNNFEHLYHFGLTRWHNNKITHTTLNKTLMYIAEIYKILSRADDNLSNYYYINKIDLTQTRKNLSLSRDDTTEFLNLVDEIGLPRGYFKESSVDKILAGKLALNTDKRQDCPVCKEPNVKCVPINWICGHYICVECHNDIVEQEKCPICRFEFKI